MELPRPGSRVIARFACLRDASPYVITLPGEPSGILVGKPAVEAYWRKALGVFPDLHFELVTVLVGVQSITLYYKGARGRLLAEVLHFDAERKVSRAFAHYAIETLA